MLQMPSISVLQYSQRQTWVHIHMCTHTHTHTHTYQKEIIINMKVSTPRKIVYRDGGILSSLR